MEWVYPDGSEDFFLKGSELVCTLKHNSITMTVKIFKIKEGIMDYKKERIQSIILGIRVFKVPTHKNEFKVMSVFNM